MSRLKTSFGKRHNILLSSMLHITHRDRKLLLVKDTVHIAQKRVAKDGHGVTTRSEEHSTGAIRELRHQAVKRNLDCAVDTKLNSDVTVVALGVTVLAIDDKVSLTKVRFLGETESAGYRTN